MSDTSDRAAFARDVESRTKGYTQEWLDRPGVREKLASYDHLVKPMTGLWALMNDKQRAALMAYTGEENHGPADHRA